MLLGSEQQDARIGGQYRTVLGLEKVTRILAALVRAYGRGGASGKARRAR